MPILFNVESSNHGLKSISRSVLKRNMKGVEAIKKQGEKKKNFFWEEVENPPFRRGQVVAVRKHMKG